MNGDDKLDLIVTSELSAAVLVGQCNGRFYQPLHFGTDRNDGAMAFGDMDADGKLEVLVGNGGEAQGSACYSTRPAERLRYPGLGFPVGPPNQAPKSRFLGWEQAGLDSKQRCQGTGGLTGSATQPAEVRQLS